MESQLINSVETDLDGRRVITVSGVIDLRTAEAFSVELNESLDSSESDVVIDLSAVEFLDSTGVTALMRGGKTLRSHNRELILVSSKGPVRRVLEVSGADEVFRVVASLDDANTDGA